MNRAVSDGPGYGCPLAPPPVLDSKRALGGGLPFEGASDE